MLFKEESKMMLEIKNKNKHKNYFFYWIINGQIIIYLYFN